MDSNIDPEVSGINQISSNSKLNEFTKDSITEDALNLINEFNQSEIMEVDDDDDSNSNSTPKLYAYNPNEKPPRLGRPRRNINHSLSPPETSSSQNHNSSKISKFRLDSKPIEGSGSRGGKGNRKPPRGRITNESVKRQKQSTLNFEPEQPVPRQKLILKLPPQKQLQSSTQKPRRSVKKTKSNVKKISKTTVIYTRPKQSRQLPSSLVGLTYDLYDDNLIDAYFDSKNEKLALNYPIIKNPYASDIIYIISFLLKFKEIIPLENCVGPHSFEIGLSLPIYEDENHNELKYNKRKEKLVNGPDYDPNYISIQMEDLFKKLLSLVLNRKKEVTSHSKAISELKSQTEILGLPKEWKSYQIVKDLKYPNIEPVDPQNPEILMDEVIKRNNHYITKFNPFYDSNFEMNGLKGLSPVNRLIMLRTLVQWCFIQSESIKNYITTLNQNIDLPGERDTFYASRAIIYGFKNANDTKYEVEKKLSKRKSKSEDDVKYIDPTSNPKSHPLNLRLNELIAGDLGFHIGRFYLVRMSDEYNGGLSSVKKMNNVWSGNAGLNGPLPSNFKLYVQDTHQMLLEALSSDGVEFNSNGKEIKPSYKNTNESNHWFEIASNSKELHAFIIFLSKRLSIIENTTGLKSIPMASLLYKSTFQLYEYLEKILPLIQKQEELLENKKSTRRKPIDYSDRRAVERLGMEPDEIIENIEEDDENYVDPELVDVDDVEDDEYADEEEIYDEENL
ncbi:unnamed protein product [Candida verbasci]|uniref:WHIM1 domain-containing protein n=1 Tax=Candida verbasci TaxID=1227364 RepID=A0A9W4TVD3_9ASCO|nr:unnamed protein product [Candida verbasci]